ncbi:MAG: SDR family oxidoreductase [Burkholderiales bacterium]|nr:SDR family oxidoreductase [Burkholderiales bacterium]
MHVVVLGAYGLIGSEVVAALLRRGDRVTGLGRQVDRAQRAQASVRWLCADLRDLTLAARWQALLREDPPNAIVNCAGLLQTSGSDGVSTIQRDAIVAMIDAASALGVQRFVQISAPGAAATADTEFMRSKGDADDYLAAQAGSQLAWWILRPGLVLARGAYGGSALLRALAAFPGVIPVTHADAPLQTVDVDDIAGAVVACLHGEIPPGERYDLLEMEAHGLRDVVVSLRAWLALREAPVVRLPDAVGRAVARGADALAWLGWRSPLRSTALRELEHGVRGDATRWRQVSGRALCSLEQTLASHPATVQDRWFARLWLLKPALVATLSLFWLLTALVAVIHPAPALHLLGAMGLSETRANTIVYGGAALDTVLGLMVLHRRAVPVATLGMVLATAGYLVAATLLAPSLWLDPLGPLLKPVPGALLALVLRAIADDR